jgi:hypothetical protein
MKIHPYGLLVVLLSFPLTVSSSRAATATKGGASAEAATLEAVSTAKTFLAALDDKLRAKASLPLNPKTRANWSNLPTGATFQSGSTERNGVKLGDLSPAQQEAALALVAATLSPGGYKKVINMVNADEVLERNSATKRKAESRTRFGRAEFYVAILGTPSASQPWMIQFGGHHLAINITLVGAQNVLTPSHTGAQPSDFTFEGQSIRPLGNENDKAFALINALDANQQKQAMLDYQVRDVVAGPGHDGEVVKPEGVRAFTFNPAQTAMLLDLIKEWVGIVHDNAAAAKMAEIQANLADTYFAWSGPTTNGSAAYFRIQGPTVLIEYAPQRTTDHIHTFYRDPTNDYGAKLIKP